MRCQSRGFLFLFSVGAASGGFYFGRQSPSAGFPTLVSTGSVWRVIIALVYSVYVCQMDATASAAAVVCSGKVHSSEKKKKRKPFYFTS